MIDFAVELIAQLQLHPKLRIVDTDGTEWVITDVTYDPEYDNVVVEIDVG